MEKIHMNLHKNSNYIFHEIQIKYWDSDFIAQTKYHWQYSRCWTLHNDCRWHYRQEQKQNPGFCMPLPCQLYHWGKLSKY